MSRCITVTSKIAQRKQELRNEIEHNRAKFQKGLSLRQELVYSLSVVLVAGLAFVSGAVNSEVVTSSSYFSGGADFDVENSSDELVIGEYRFVFLPDSSDRMKGDTYGQVDYSMPDTVFIQKGLSVFKTYKACGHELMHLRNKGKDSEEFHDWIYEVHGFLPDRVCFDLVRRRFGDEAVGSVRSEVLENFKGELSVVSFSG